MGPPTLAVTLHVGDPPVRVADFGTLSEARAFVQDRAEALGRKCVERDCEDGRVQFIVKAHETVGAAGLMALVQATVYEVRGCA